MNERGEVLPERIFPVFRDEEELATGNLTRRIHEALAQSKVLVVLCSRQAVQSNYVDEEVTYFKSLFGPEVSDQRVQAVIINGDPNAKFAAALQCFPGALLYEVHNGTVVKDRPVVPLAVDFRLPDGTERWTGPEAYRQALKAQRSALTADDIEQLVSGYRQRLKDGLLKLISSVLGVPYRKLDASGNLHWPWRSCHDSLSS